MKLISFFIKQSLVVNITVAFITIAGMYIFITGQKEGFPSISIDTVYIITRYMGASPQEVEKLITDKIEKAVKEIDGAKSITSRSIEGLSTVIFTLDPDYSSGLQKTVSDIRSAVDGIRDLPDGAEDPIVMDINMDMIPIISVVLGGTADESVLRDFSLHLEKELTVIPGVGKLEKEGYRSREIWIEADPAALRDREMDISEVIMAIKLRSINLPGGKIFLEDKEYLIRTVGQYQTLDDIKNTIVRGNDTGNIVYVKDIASVDWQFEKREQMVRVDGNTVIYHKVLKKKSGDIIKVCDAVKALVAEYNMPDRLPENVKMFYSDDLSYITKKRLQVLSQNLAVGLVLIFFCLIIFFDFKTTLWTTLGIPIAFCSAMIIAHALDITLNLMSMFGFIIVIGMIVDDAIIVAENIYRHRELGKDGLSAAIDGTSEVIRPILATVTTTIAAFLPLIMLTGMMGKFLGVIPKIVAITMASSFIECLFVLPGHLISFSKTSGHGSTDALPRGWFSRFQNRYGKFLSIILKHPLRNFLLVCVICCGFLVVALKKIPFVFFPSTIDELVMIVEGKPSNSLQQTQELIDKVEERIRNTLGPDAREFISTVGYYDLGAGGIKMRPFIGGVRILLEHEKKRSIREIISELNTMIKNVEGITFYSLRQVTGGPPQEKPISVKIFSADLKVLKKTADRVIAAAEAISNTAGLECSYEEGKDELILQIDDQKAIAARVNVNSAAIAVRNAFEGGIATTANTMREANEDVKVIVKYNENKSRKLSDLKNVKILNQFGKLIPLDNFASFAYDRSTAVIHREEGDRLVHVTGELLNPRDRVYTAEKISRVLKEKTDKIVSETPGVRIDAMAGGKENQEMIQSAMRAMVITFALIFIILTALFKSALQPFMVMTAIPFGFIGVVFGIFIHYLASFVFDMPISQYALSFMSILGMIALSGVVVNDSLVLVSFVNKNRANGMSKRDALISAGKGRLRPIMLTTLTTLVGLVPMSYGIMGSEPSIQPMGVALVWGLTVATCVTLILLPCIYYCIDALAIRVYRLFGRIYVLPATLE